MCLCHQVVHFGTGQGAVMLCGWEDNCRSGVTLAMFLFIAQLMQITDITLSVCQKQGFSFFCITVYAASFICDRMQQKDMFHASDITDF